MEQNIGKATEAHRPPGLVIMEIAEKYQDSPNVVNAREDAKKYAETQLRIASQQGLGADPYRWELALHFAETGEEEDWGHLKREIGEDGKILLAIGDSEELGRALINLSDSIILYLL